MRCYCENPLGGDCWAAIGEETHRVMDFQVCENCGLPIDGSQTTHTNGIEPFSGMRPTTSPEQCKTAGLKSPAQYLASLRRTRKHTCPVCGAEFAGLVRAVYCSDRCRQAASRARRKSK